MAIWEKISFSSPMSVLPTKDSQLPQLVVTTRAASSLAIFWNRSMAATSLLLGAS